MSGTSNVHTSIKDLQSPLQIQVPSISLLRFPFELKEDQIAAVDAWINNNFRGTILYSTGTGKTEIAFECARMRANYHKSSNANHAASSIINGDDNTPIKPNLLSPIGGHTLFNIDGVEKTDLSKKITDHHLSFFNILFLVPRISLIDQNIKRLTSYGIPQEKIGAFFGERKEIREIIISTYQSIVKNLDIVRRSNMVIFDEVHLIRDTAKSFSKIFDVVVEDPKRAILGLTATLDEKDFKNSSILAVLPPIKRYSIGKAVSDKRLAKPIVIPIKVHLTPREENEYDAFCTKIKNISGRFKRYDATSMTVLLKKGGFASGMAKAWFANVRKRKLLLSYAENKLSAAVNIITKRFPQEKIMVFSETIESIEKLRDLLDDLGIKSRIIDAKVKTSARQKILDQWGHDFNVLLSVHTLEIGYDVPAVRIEIILATTSNMNQVIQRIGRVIRKQEGKDVALIYVIYVSDTKDDNVIDLVKKAVKSDSEPISQENIEEKIRQMAEEQSLPSARTKSKLESKDKQKDRNKILVKDPTIDEDIAKRVERAYSIIESNLQGPLIVEQKQERQEEQQEPRQHGVKGKNLYRVQSSKDKNKFYEVNIEEKTCTCADYMFRKVKCKHIISTEFVLP